MQVKYKKIRADFKYAEKGRFYRVFLVREDVSLPELGEFIVTIFGGTMEHFFLFHEQGIDYVDESWLEECDEWVGYSDKSLLDLGDKFEFDYDTGDGWDFDCKVYKTEVIKEFEEEDEELWPFGFVLEGKGMGIWEDNISSLYAYLNGEIDKDFDGEDEELCVYKPWNFEITKYSEFDDPIDVDKLNNIAMYFIPDLFDEEDI